MRVHALSRGHLDTSSTFQHRFLHHLLLQLLIPLLIPLLILPLILSLQLLFLLLLFHLPLLLPHLRVLVFSLLPERTDDLRGFQPLPPTREVCEARPVS